MKKDRVNVIIKKAYANRYGLRAPVPVTRPRSDFYLTRVQPVLARLEPVTVLMRKRLLVVALILAAVLIWATIYYYNALVIAEQNMHASMGHVNALLQRRNDTAVNLYKAVIDYADHERTVLSAVVALRGLSSDKAPGAEVSPDTKTLGQKVEQLQELLHKAGNKGVTTGNAPTTGQAPATGNNKAAGVALPTGLMSLSALAEQYPDLKLSANFQTLMTVLDQIEKDLAAIRMKHDEMVNTYATKVQIFPSSLFAKIFGFNVQPYFEATEEARKFKPIK